MALHHAVNYSARQLYIRQGLLPWSPQFRDDYFEHGYFLANRLRTTGLDFLCLFMFGA